MRRDVAGRPPRWWLGAPPSVGSPHSAPAADVDAVAQADLIRSGAPRRRRRSWWTPRSPASRPSTRSSTPWCASGSSAPVPRPRPPRRARRPFRGVPFLLKDLSAEIARRAALRGHAVPPRRAVPGAVHRRSSRAASSTPGSSSSAAPTPPSSGLLPTTEPATYGPTHNPWKRRDTRPAARAEARPPRSRAAWSRSRTRTTAAARSASPRRAAGSSASSRPAGRVPDGTELNEISNFLVCRARRHAHRARHRGGARRHRRPPPRRCRTRADSRSPRSRRRSDAIRARLRIGFLDADPTGTATVHAGVRHRGHGHGAAPRVDWGTTSSRRSRRRGRTPTR